jgi:hypothetical protein
MGETKTQRVAFRATMTEVHMLADLAEHEERSGGDVLRRLVRQAHAAIIRKGGKKPSKAKG